MRSAFSKAPFLQGGVNSKTAPSNWPLRRPSELAFAILSDYIRSRFISELHRRPTVNRPPIVSETKSSPWTLPLSRQLRPNSLHQTLTPR